MILGGWGGILVGLIPFIIGILKKQKVLGSFGINACLISGMIGGLILAIPVGIIFTWYIFKRAGIINKCPICGDEIQINADVCEECAKDLDIIE